MSLPRVAVVVVSHNSAALLPRCLEALRRGADGVELTDVVVVDNASSDASREVARSVGGLPVSVVGLPENAGYAAGLNAGVELLAGRPPDAVLVLNPDCRVLPGALATLASCLARPRRGIAAPRLVNPDGSLHPTLRRIPTVRGMLVESILGGRVADRLGVGELIFAEEPHEVPGPVAWATGAALLMSWEMLLQIGPWDEHFLLYSEETEFELRAADQGWATWYEPAAVVEHEGGESGVRPDLAALLTVNRVRLFRRRSGVARGGAYAAAVVLGATLRAVAGRATARASLAALLMPSRRISSLSQLGQGRLS